MKAAWVYPLAGKCGIRFYSDSYVSALRTRCEIVTVDPMSFVKNAANALALCNTCDCVHVQYETSLFMNGGHDFYARFCEGVSRPLVVSLHEVYRRFPGVFPREEIDGFGPIRALKTLVYDIRHPAVSALGRHRCREFFAGRILVHWPNQRDIAVEQGIAPDKIRVISHPVRQTDATVARPSIDTLHLGSTGFVSPAFDYDLLFKTLARIPGDWRFTWIGGCRREEDEGLLKALRARADSLGWGERISFTGWVSHQQRNRLVQSLDIYCAFFENRSSSESLATALSMRRFVVATDVPFIRDLSREYQAVMVVDRSVDSACEAIQSIASTRCLRDSLSSEINRLITENSFVRNAEKLVELYGELT